ncbi:AP endonuclease [Leucogyrophana mollusca]|uniref:AP endonuclease n=1 Tax=Leucogyrophana mollusca TaxID=85980 RepID=A0ACB8B819_9AGAM|nr:AP endonuclease [Leucogyrophana mollusca]
MVQTRSASQASKATAPTVPTTRAPKRERLKEGDAPAKKRRKKDDELVKLQDFPTRFLSPWKVGAHVSAAGGVENTIYNAASVGANAFALFVKSQRKWTSPSLAADSISSFKARMKEFGYSPAHVLPHGSYLINLGNPDGEKREKSYECFLDDLQRCELLGLELYNFHPGSTVGQTTKENCITLIAECINRSHKTTTSVITVIENMAGSGNIIGSDFAELGDIIRQVDDKSRVGVCLDTCHAFAAGYDITSKAGWDSTLADFDAQVGLSYLKALHLNDSKMPLASKRDRHENIGLGHLGIHTFRHIVTDPRMQNIPLILETPSFEANEVWTKEIAALNQLSDIGLDEKSTKALEETLTGEIRAVVRARSSGQTTKKSRSRKSKNEGDHECNHDED